MPRKRIGFGTIVLAAVVVLLAVWLFNLYEKANPKAAPLSPQATQQLADVETFVGVLEEVGIDKSLIIRCECGVDHEIRIVVVNRWHLQPRPVRVHAARLLWQTWAKIHTAEDLDQSRIVLLDRSGNEVGGSRASAGSTIWVKE